MFEETNFPDEKYLEDLLLEAEKRVNSYRWLGGERLLTVCGRDLNWIADYVLDPNIIWTRRTLNTKDLYLTGTNPKWNEIIINQCHRSPQELWELMCEDQEVADEFSRIIFIDEKPILVRYEDDKYKVLHGMRRAIVAILSNYRTIEAFVGQLQGKFQPQCEAHVIYDFLRSYQRGINKDREGLITALRFLKKSYSNVEQLLRQRFSGGWMTSGEIQQIINEVLE